MSALAAQRESLREWLARGLYSSLLRLFTPAYLVRLWWRGRHEAAYRLHWRERLALAGPTAAPGALWLHAVSLGETRAAASMIEALRRQQPGLRLLLTHGTATGRVAGEALLREGDLQVWLPYDTPGAAQRFIARHRPAIGVLMETEIWPNLQQAAALAGVPMVLANARLSERSAGKGQRMQALMGPAVRRLALVLAQTEDDAARLREAGAPAVEVCGNLKFDMAPSEGALAQGRAWREGLQRPVVLAASTRQGEELPLLAAWKAHPMPRPLLLLVPRHPQRFEEVAAAVLAQGLTLCRRSAWLQTPPPEAMSADVWLGDSLGEMALYYGVADVALLGGSFEPLGGQNLIEAAACGCPLIMGPHTFNFAQASEMAIDAGAAVRVADIGAAVALALTWTALKDRTERAARALAFVAPHKGASDRMAARILALKSTLR